MPELDLEAIIGLEIHAQISTKTKMFASDSAEYFGTEPNLNITPVSMGFPGQLPVLNGEAVDKGVKAALALNCTIHQESVFDRKNYFYPDLPKGYQISQFERPVSTGGFVDIELGEGRTKRIRVTRLHLEEDAGKLTHFQGGTLIDFNRCGVGLMEIVSEPDLRSSEEAVAYARAIQMILRYTDSSYADMEKGMMRFDASVSLRPKGEEKLYARAEIKNLNSFKSLDTAINFEIERQKKLWFAGETPQKDSTVGYDDTKAETYFMRWKEGSDDYRYFPEPDLPPLVLTLEKIEKLRSEIPMLPRQKYEFYLSKGLSESDSLFLVEDIKLFNYFDQVVKICDDYKKTSSFVLSILGGILKKDGVLIEDVKIRPEQMGRLITLVNNGAISMNLAKAEIFEEMFSSGADPEKIIESKGLKTMSNSAELQSICEKMVAANDKIVQDYLGGKQNAFMALVGMVMKETKGQANATMVNQILHELIKK